MIKAEFPSPLLTVFTSISFSVLHWMRASMTVLRNDTPRANVRPSSLHLLYCLCYTIRAAAERRSSPKLSQHARFEAPMRHFEARLLGDSYSLPAGTIGTSLIASCRACEGSSNNVNRERAMNTFMEREPPYCVCTRIGCIVLLLHTVDSRVCCVGARLHTQVG